VNVLREIVDSTRADVAARRSRQPLAELERAAATRPAPRPFAAALGRPGLSVIAEHKRRSPSAGTLRADSTVQEIVSAYERAGAAALSILTEEPNFGGSLDDLRAAREVTSLPVLRKDFIVDSYQLYESAAAGADAVLLIVAALEPPELARLHDEARALELDVLVEVHDENELGSAAEAGAQLIGINNRDLTDFSVDVGRTLALLPQVPAGAVVVSESGLASPEQLDELERAGVHAVLVGEALMRAPDPEQACRALAMRP
jgi:indole-3-glycerol phosphate synthase